MKKHNPPKLQLSISEPCHEKWGEMTPVQGGRFCHQCDRHIVNFTDMSDHELAFYYQKHKGKICGVFRPDQLDRPIALPVTPVPSGKWKVAAAVAAGLLAGSGMNAQQSLEREVISVEQEWKKGKVVEEATPSSDRILKGIVVNEEGEPLIGVSILIEGTMLGTVTDIDGTFTLYIPSKYKKPVLHISYTGYKTITVKNFHGNEEQRIEMKEDIASMGEVVVVGGTFGRYSANNAHSKQEKKTKIKLTKVSPNPFADRFSVQLKANKEGSYLVNLYNLDGQLIFAEAFDLVKGKQILSLDNFPNSLAAGSYILQVTRDNEILLTEKVVKAE